MTHLIGMLSGDTRTYNPELASYFIMASILDQFEEASQRIPATGSEISWDVTAGGPPMFAKKRVNFVPSDRILHMCVCSETILIAMANDVILRINLRQPEVPEEIDISRHSSAFKVAGLYLNPSGHHSLLRFIPKNTDTQSELYYLSSSSFKLKQASKFRGFDITAVAWTRQNSSKTSSGPTLLGTSKGLLIEAAFTSDSEGIFGSSPEEYWKQVFDIGKGTNTAVTGLEMFQNGNEYHILATTSNKIYHFRGTVINLEERPLLQQVFRTYLSIPENVEKVLSLINYSRLDLFYKTDETRPKWFAWLTGNGIYYGQIPDGDDVSLLNNCDLLKFHDDLVPENFILTEYHLLLLFPNKIKGIFMLNQEVVFEDNFSETYGKLGRILRESRKNSVWLFTEKAVFNYKIYREDRNAWQEYVNRGDFDMARECVDNNPVLIDIITAKQAEKLFNSGDYLLAALYYSQSVSISFEEIALKFLRNNEIFSLMKFLRLRLDNLPRNQQLQRTMLVLWLLELYLAQQKPKEWNLEEEFQEFLEVPAVRDCVAHNKGTVYDLMAAHGDSKHLEQLALMHRDYQRVIRQHVYKGNFKEALEVLKKSEGVKKDLFYQFSPTLMKHIPQQLIRVLIQFGKSLQPIKLLPALASCYSDKFAAYEAINYLEYCVNELIVTDQAVHNLLLSLYVRHSSEKLKNYLTKEGQILREVHYDVHFALRLCQEANLTEACVQLSTLLGLWTSAVELALTVSVDLAVETANLQQNDSQLSKALWLKIAEHVVKEMKDLKAAMHFLRKCELLRIEDILPFFPDFVTIESFKEEICKSLKDYNEHIQYLKQEMDEATRSAEVIAQQMTACKNRCAVIKWTDSCTRCNLQLLLRGFYAFPCSHNFHIDCLIETIRPNVSPSNRMRLSDLQKELGRLNSDNVSNASTGTSARDLILSAIDNLIASECPLCGDNLISLIDQPFIPDEDFDQVIKEWM